MKHVRNKFAFGNRTIWKWVIWILRKQFRALGLAHSKTHFIPCRTFIIVVSHREIPLAVQTNSPDNLRIARHKLGFNLNLSRRTVFTICVRGLDSKRKAKQNNTTGFYFFFIQSRIRIIGRQLANQFLSPRLSRYPGCVRVMECRETIFESWGEGGLSPLNLARCWIKSRQAGALPPAAAMPPPHAAPLFLIGRKKNTYSSAFGLSSCVHGAVSLSRPMFVSCCARIRDT